MTLLELEQVLRGVTAEVAGGDGAWEFKLSGVHMACLTDARFDRMRIIAPITDVDDLEEGQTEAMLEANFHSALDGRYAISGGVVYAAFIHPLSTLDTRALTSALGQISSLVLTFGEEYSSGALHFASGSGEMN